MRHGFQIEAVDDGVCSRCQAPACGHTCSGQWCGEVEPHRHCCFCGSCWAPGRIVKNGLGTVPKEPLEEKTNGLDQRVC